MHSRKIVFGLVLTIVLFVVQHGEAFAADSDSSAKKAYIKAGLAYQRVLSTDPEVTDLSEWENAAAELERFVEAHPKSSSAAGALFDLGRLYTRTFEKRQHRAGLSKAIYNFERLARDFHGHMLVDDALLELGDLRRSGLKDEAAARAAYYEVLDVYKDGDQTAQARKRLGLSTVASRSKKGSTGVKTKDTQSAAPNPSQTPASESRPEESRSFLARVFSPEPSESKEIFSRKSPLRRPVICIDPGHGGEETGAKGLEEGVFEKDIVLNISLYLDELLRQRLRARTILTRARDMPLPLEDRIKIANEKKADLFVSIHTNATRLHNASGIETYYLDNTDDKSSLKLAQRENISLGRSIGDVDFIISDLIQNLKMDESISLAHYVQNSLHQTLSRYYKDVKNLGVKKAPFYVLVGAHMPCALTEVSFIDHPVDGRRLMQRRYQKLIARALFYGIREFFERQK